MSDADPDRAELLRLQVDAPRGLSEKLFGGKPAAEGGEPEPVGEGEGELSLDGQVVRWRARAERTRLAPEHSDQHADIFAVSYQRVQPDAGQRPLTFCFNGGPGSSSVWLHLGAWGPRRVQLDEVGRPLPGPARLEDNDCSLLDVSDLVFVDPVSTGFSRAVPAGQDGGFHGVDSDLDSMARFIARYLDRNDRWGSPIYLAGESYGGFRVAGLADRLQATHGIYPEGVILVSPAIHLQTIRTVSGNDLPYLLLFPSLVASARYHEVLEPDLLRIPLSELLKIAETFALGPLSSSLMRGAALPAKRKGEIAGEISRLTGLDRELVLRHELRITTEVFAEELLASRGLSCGRLDARYLGPERWATRQAYLRDPSFSAIQGAYTSAINQLLRVELGYKSELPYEVFTRRITRWSADSQEGRFVETGQLLRDAMVHNPALRVHVAAGLYDLATPYASADYSLNHLGAPVELIERISRSRYEAGHMMYVHRPSHRQLREALVPFIQPQA